MPLATGLYEQTNIKLKSSIEKGAKLDNIEIITYSNFFPHYHMYKPAGNCSSDLSKLVTNALVPKLIVVMTNCEMIISYYRRGYSSVIWDDMGDIRKLDNLRQYWAKTEKTSYGGIGQS